MGAGVIYSKLQRYNRRIRRRKGGLGVLSPKPGGEGNEGAALNKPRLKRAFSVFEKLPVTPVNPFVNQTWIMSHYELLKLSLMGVTVFPIRAASCLATLGVCSAW